MHAYFAQLFYSGVFHAIDNNYVALTECFNPVSHVLATSGLEILHIRWPQSYMRKAILKNSCVCSYMVILKKEDMQAGKYSFY